MASPSQRKRSFSNYAVFFLQVMMQINGEKKCISARL